MPLPTMRLPMASTSSLEFFGLTVSFCSTGFCWPACVCSEGGVDFAGSGAGGGLCANTVPPAKVASSPSLSALPSVSFMVSPPGGLFRVYTRLLQVGPWCCRFEYDVLLWEEVSFFLHRLEARS